MPQSQQLQITAFPIDYNIGKSRIEILRYGNFISVKQDDYILGSIKLENDYIPDPETWEHPPMVVITICNGVRQK